MTPITINRAVVEQALEALEDAKALLNNKDRTTTMWFADEITALRAALAQQVEPDLSRCPQCNGPADNGFDRNFPPSPYLCKKCMAEPVQPGAWVASKDGRVIYDYVSTDDCLLRVSGDFENDEQRSRYAQRIVDKLNAAPLQQDEPVEPVAQFDLNTMPGQADAHLRALLRYTENFYATAIEHGMRAGPTANAIAHVERAGKALHQIVHAQAKMLEPARPAQPVEPVEPVAWIESPHGAIRANPNYKFTFPSQLLHWQIPLYTAPPQRKLVPLTEEEIDAEWHKLDGEASALFKRVIRKFARAVEKASWEKNHGKA